MTEIARSGRIRDQRAEEDAALLERSRAQSKPTPEDDLAVEQAIREARGKQLTSLDHTIREGNSVISDPAVHPKAFDWLAVFPEVLDKMIGLNESILSNVEGAFVGFQELRQAARLLPGYQDAGIKRDGHL
jgi:hypothetical protein